MSKTWVPHTWHNLLTLLRTSKVEASQGQVVHSTLTTYQGDLACPLDFPKRDPQHLQEIKNGKGFMNGSSFVIEAGNIEQIISLAEELDLDEHFACSIFHEVLSICANKQAPLTSCLLHFYRERASQLACLEYLLENALPGSAHPLQALFHEFVTYVSRPDNGLIHSTLAHLSKYYSFTTITKPYCAGLKAKDHDAIIRFRLAEAQSLGRIYYKLCECSSFKLSDVSNLVLALSQAQSINSVYIHLLVTLLKYLNVLTTKVALRLVEENSLRALREQLMGVEWKIKPAQALAQLFLGLFLFTYYNYGPGDSETQTNLLGVGNSMASSLKAGGLHFAIIYFFTELERTQKLTQSFKGQTTMVELGRDSLMALHSEKPTQGVLLENYLCEPKFRKEILLCLGFFLPNFIGKLAFVLSKLHRTEEDQLLHHPTQKEVQVSPAQFYQRRHFETSWMYLPHEGLYGLTTLVFSQQPDPQMVFLNDKTSLLGFLRTATMSQSSRLFIAALDMVGGLASHEGYADWAFRAFIDSSAAHPFKWAWLHDHLTTLAKSVRSVSGLPYVIPEKDVLMLRGFLRLYVAVFSKSALAHASPGEGHGVTMLRPLFALLSCPLVTSLKAQFLQAIGVVAHSRQSYELISQMWVAIDELGLVKSEHSMAVELTKHEFELESNHLALAFLGFMDQLICFKAPRDGGAAWSTKDLGASYRPPGTHPYMAFIIDELFVKAFSRTYRHFYQKWEVIDACLGIMYKCLVDLSHLLDFDQPYQQLALHPGFYIVWRILQTGSLSEALLSLIDSGVKDLEGYPHGLYPSRERATLRTLQILHIVVTLQEAYFTKLSSSRKFLYEHYYSAVAAAPLRELFLRHNRDSTLIQLASYVSYSNADIASLSVRLLSSLCTEKPPSDIGTGPILQMLWSQPDCYLVTEWFRNELTHSPHISLLDDEESNPTAAILDAILRDVDSEPAHSFSNLLLGYVRDPVNRLQLQLVHESSTCFHAILGLLNQTLRPTSSGQASLINYSSDIVSKCFQILARLCTNKATSGATLLYLRSQHKFSLDHLHRLPPMPSLQVNAGLVTKLDQEHRALTHDIINHVQICTSVFEIATQELSESGGQGEFGRHLVRAILGLDLNTSVNPLWVTEFLFAATTSWHRPDFIFNAATQQLLTQIENGNCFRVVRNGVGRWDVDALKTLLFATETQASQSEKQALLNWICLENDVPLVIPAQKAMTRAWAELLKLAVTLGSGAVDAALLELAILELMLGLLLYIQSRPWEHGLEVIGEVLLHLATKLHNDFRHSTASFEVSSDRAHLLVSKMTLVWDGLVQILDISGGFESLRLSVYTSIEPYLNYIRSFGSTSSLPAGIRLSARGQELLVGNACYDIMGNSQKLKLASLKLLAYLCPLLPLHLDHQFEVGTYLPQVLPKQCNVRALVEDLKRDVLGMPKVHNNFEIYQARINLLIALAQTPIGVSQLLENNIFRILIESGLFDAHLDESVVGKDNVPAQEKSYQTIEPLLRLLSSLLENGLSLDAGKQASLALYSHSELLSSVLNFTGRRLTLRCLRLTEQAVAFIAKVTLSCRSLSWKEYGVSSIYLIPILNMMAFFSDRSLWADRLLPYFAEEKPAPKVHHASISPEITSFQCEVERVVDAILMDAAVYCRVVFCDGTPLVPLQSPIGFQPVLETYDSSSALINFTPKASIKSLLDILHHSHQKLIKQCRNNSTQLKLLEDLGKISVDRLSEIVPFSSSDSPLEVRINHMRSRAKLVLDEQICQNTLIIRNQLNILKEVSLLLYRQLDIILDIDSPTSPLSRSQLSHGANQSDQLSKFKSALEVPLKKILLDILALDTKSTFNQLEAESSTLDYLHRLSKLTLELVTPLVL